MRKLLFLFSIVGVIFFQGGQNILCGFLSMGSYVSAQSYLTPFEYGDTKLIGGTARIIPSFITADHVGNIYISGTYSNNHDKINEWIDFNPGEGVDIKTLSSEDDSTAFLTKINADGSYGYTKTLGNSFAYSIQVDAFGNAYVLGGRSFTKINADGSFGYTKTFNYSTHIHSSNITLKLDPVGNIYVAGNTASGTYDFDPGVGVDTKSLTGKVNFFLTKLNTDGSYGYTRTISVTGTGNIIPAYSGAIDNGGNLYLSGYYNGTITVGTETISSSGTVYNDSAFLLKMNTNGSQAYTKNFVSTGGVVRSRSVSLDPTGNVYLSGYFNGTVDFDPGSGTDPKTSTAGSNNDLFVTKIHADGAYGHTRTYNINIGGAAGTANLVTDALGNIYMLPESYGGASLIKVHTDGSYESKTFGGTNMSYLGSSLTIDPSNNIFVAGIYGTDIFLTKIANNSTFNSPFSIVSATPTGAQNIISPQVVLKVITNEDATCKYDTTSDAPYASMANTFSGTGGTVHTQVLSGMRSGSNYAYYIKCKNTAEDITNDYPVTFSTTSKVCPTGSTGTHPECQCISLSQRYDPTSNICVVNTPCSGAYTWTEGTSSEKKLSRNIASSADGMKLVATATEYIQNNGFGGSDYIYTSIDGGATWTQRTDAGKGRWGNVTSSVDGTKLAVVGYEETTCEASWHNYSPCATREGFIYTSSDAGATWIKRVNAGKREWGSIVSSSDGSQIFADGFMSNDFGDSWFAQGNGTGGIDITSSADGSKLASVADKFVYTSSDGGANWIQRERAGPNSYSSWRKITSSADGTKLAAIPYSDNSIYVSSDSGVTWTPKIVGVQGYWNDIVSSADGNTIVAVKNAILSLGTSFLEISRDGGTTWTEQKWEKTGISWPISSIALSSDGSRIVGAVQGGPILTGVCQSSCPTEASGTYPSCTCTDTTKTYNSTTNTCEATCSSGSWTELTGSGNRVWTGLTASADGTKLATTENIPDGAGFIYTSSDGGSTWTKHTNTGRDAWNGITSSSDGTKLAAIDHQGYIYTSSDSGATWIERTSSGQRAWYDIEFSSDGTKLIAAEGDAGHIYMSSDLGVTWSQQTNAGTQFWHGVASSSNGTKLVAIGQGGGYIYTSSNSGTTWTQRTDAGQKDWYDIASSTDGTKLVAVDHNGHIVTSSDSGTTWIERTNNSVSFFSVASSADGTKLAAGGWPGHIYTSIDSGVTWTEETDAPIGTWHDLAFSADGTKLFAAGHPNSGGIDLYGIYVKDMGCTTCPTGSTGTYPDCTCADTTKTYNPTTNTCNTVCPTGSTGTYPDTCVCSQTNFKYDPSTNTCVDCTPPTVVQSYCIDNENGTNEYFRGTVSIYTNGTITETATDECASNISLYDVAPYPYNEGTSAIVFSAVKEYSCSADGRISTSYLPCDLQCQDGVCGNGYSGDTGPTSNLNGTMPAGECYDTDGTDQELITRNSYFIRGATSGNLDFCVDSTRVNEYACVPNYDITSVGAWTHYKAENFVYICPNGCSNGACAGPFPWEGTAVPQTGSTTLPAICTQTCPTEAPLNTTTNLCVCTDTIKTYNATTQTCDLACPENTINMYPACRCTEDGKEYELNTNSCIAKTCPTGTTGTYPSCDCSPLGQQYSQMTNTCTGGCTQTQAPSQLQANLDQPVITCTGDAVHPEHTHFKYRLTKEGSTNAADTFTSSTSKANGTSFIHQTLSPGTYVVQCFYGTEVTVDTSTTTTPASCVQTITVTDTPNSAQGCRRIYPYKGTTLSDNMINSDSFQASFRCGSRLPLTETTTHPYFFTIEGHTPSFHPFDTLISDLFNGLAIGPVSEQTQNYFFDTGTTPVACAVKVGNGYSTTSSCQLNACVGETCSNPKSFAVFSGDSQCTSQNESTYNIGCNPEAPDTEFAQCVQWLRSSINANNTTVPKGTRFPVTMKFGGPTSTDTTIYCIEYEDWASMPDTLKNQIPEANFLEQNITCEALLDSGETVQIYAADTSGRSFQTNVRTRELDVENPKLTPIKYYTNAALTTEVSNEYYSNKPVTAIAICSDTPANEDIACACSGTVHNTETTNTDQWSQGIPNNIIGADLMRYTRLITQTVENEQVTIADTANNTSTTEPVMFFIDTEKPLITLSGDAVTSGSNSGPITITAQDSTSHIWITTATPTETLDTPAATNTNGILFRTGPATDRNTLAFDNECDLGTNTTTPQASLYATKTDIDNGTIPDQTDTGTTITIPTNHILSYCVKDNAGNVTKGFFPRETDFCFASSNMITTATVPNFTTHKDLTKSRIEAAPTNATTYGFTFSENATNAGCFRTLLSNNINQLIQGQYDPITSQTIHSNWTTTLAKTKTNDPNNPGQSNTEGYYYYDYTNAANPTNPINNTLTITANPTGSGFKSVVVEGGNIEITTNIIYTGAPAEKKYLVLVARKDINGNGGNIEITKNVTRIDAILIADGGSLISEDPVNPGNRLTINGRIYSYNTRGGSLAIDSATSELTDATIPKIFTNNTLSDTNPDSTPVTLIQAQQHDLEHFRTIDLDGTNTCSVYLDYYNFDTETLPPLLRRPSGETGECGLK